MTVALRYPELLRALVPVDNAPIDANLKSAFYGYAQGMREIEEQQVIKQGEADKILEKYEKGREIFKCVRPFKPNSGGLGFSRPTISTHKSRPIAAK